MKKGTPLLFTSNYCLRTVYPGNLHEMLQARIKSINLHGITIFAFINAMRYLHQLEPHVEVQEEALVDKDKSLSVIIEKVTYNTTNQTIVFSTCRYRLK